MRYSSWVIPLTTRKIKIFKKWKKHLDLEMSSFYTCVPKITIIWCMLPEIWNTTDITLSFWAILCSFTPLLTPKVKIWNKSKSDLEILSYYTCVSWMKIIWCMVPEIWGRTNSVFILLGHFLPFDPPNNLKSQNFEKMEKMPEDIIILHCIPQMMIMMYGSWNMEHDRQNFWRFWLFFPLLPP